MTIFYTSDIHIGHRLVAGTRGYWDEDNVVEVFGDDRLLGQFACEPDTDAHDEDLARVWDEQVGPKDTVFLLGDTGLGKFETVVLPWLDARPGIKHLIAGNHDPVHPARSDAIRLSARWLQTFATIQPYATRKLLGQKVLLQHFPYASWGDGDTHGEPGEGRWSEWRLPDTGKLLIHGHTHGKEQAHHGNMFHVGWDAWGQLVPQDTILDWIREVKGL